MTDYKVGDRVRLVKDYTRALVEGSEGTIEDRGTGLYPWYVKFDSYDVAVLVGLDEIQPLTNSDLPDVRFLNAALALYGEDWTPTGEAILEIIEQARKMREVLEP